jgi:hypothetical protein
VTFGAKQVAIRTLSAIFDYLRANPRLTQLASAWTAPSGLAGIAALLRRQVRIFREEFGDPGAPDAEWEDIYVASGMFGIFTAALATGQPQGIDAMLRLLPGCNSQGHLVALQKAFTGRELWRSRSASTGRVEGLPHAPQGTGPVTAGFRPGYLGPKDYRGDQGDGNGTAVLAAGADDGPGGV